LKYQIQVFPNFNIYELFPTGLLCDLLWSDPEKDISGWAGINHKWLDK